MCYHPFWLGQYEDKNATVLRAPLIQLKCTLKHWKNTFSYFGQGSEFRIGYKVGPHEVDETFQHLGREVKDH